MQMLIHQFVSTVNTLCTTHDLILIYAKIFFHNHKLTETGHRNSFFTAKKLFSGLTLSNLHRRLIPGANSQEKRKGGRKRGKQAIEEHLASDTILDCHARDCYLPPIPILSFFLRNRTANQQLGEWLSQKCHLHDDKSHLHDDKSQHSQRVHKVI